MNILFSVRHLFILLPLLAEVLFPPLIWAGGHNFSNVSLPTSTLTLVRGDQTDWYSTLSFTGDTLQTGGGVLANTQMNENSKSALNGCSPLTEFQSLEGKFNYAADALTGCITVPSGTTVHNANAVAGYANSSSSSQGTGGTVAGYFQGRALADDAAVWGSNSIAYDLSGLTSGVKLISSELDLQPQNPPYAYTTVIGQQISLFTPQPGTFANSKAIVINHGQRGFWDTGIFIDNGNVANYALVVGASCGSGTCDSSKIQFIGLSYRSEQKSTIYGDRVGNIVLAPKNGGAVKTDGPMIAAGSQRIYGCRLTTSQGGSWAGSFESGITGTCTVTITPGITAPTGFACQAQDLTTPAQIPRQTAYSQTTATLSLTSVSGDLFTWSCVAF